MELSPEIIGQVLSLPPQDRYELAQHLLDSIDDAAAADLDRSFLDDLKRRREDMLNGNEIVADWRASISKIEENLKAENRR